MGRSQHLVVMMVGLGVIFCGILTAEGGKAQSHVRPIRTTVCEISGQPSRFAGKVVVFSGRYESDGIERSVLTDSNCKDVGIAVSAPEHFKGEDDLKKALRVGHPGTLDKTISGTFVGRFAWRPEENPKRILTLAEVRDLVSIPK